MKLNLLKWMLGLGMVIGVQTAFGQEICDNGIDDDADGFIDLNDTDCDCGGITGSSGSVTNLIPNASFEDMDCCPSSYSQLNCAQNWVQASSATSDYFNLCDYSYLMGYAGAPLLPTTDGGSGYVGFYSNPGWEENIGTCLISPMLAGQTYTLNMSIAWGDGNSTLDLTFYGTPNCSDLPWFTTDCAVGSGSWQILDVQTVNLMTDGSWQTVTFNFTPTTDINAVSIGGPCGGNGGFSNYYYIDALTLGDSAATGLTETGTFCGGDLALTAEIDTTGGNWQWYQDGIALVGETSNTLDIINYPEGVYTAVYFLGSECSGMAYTYVFGDTPIADFTADPVCFPTSTDFSDGSTISGGSITGWQWDFGDGNTSSSQNPSNAYGSPGVYDVELIVTSDQGCTDTIVQQVNVAAPPTADFEFEINGVSSADGLTGDCILSVVQYIDFTVVTAPDYITDWYWEFGDGGTSTDEQPSHNYAAAGTYTITLTITTAGGCQSSYSMDIIMTSSPAINPVFNDPTCFGFSDGSISLNITGATGNETFLIENAAGTPLNVGGSNAANNLASGWYYYVVDGGSGCMAVDSVELINPGEIDVVLNISEPLCYGQATGIVEVDTVYNWQTDYNGISFFWNPNPSGTGGLGADSAWAMAAGDYTLTVNDANGCSNVFDFTIDEPAELYFTEIGTSPAYCRSQPWQNAHGVVFAAAGGGTPDYTYLWTDLQDMSTTNNTTWGGLSPGQYQISVTDANGCVLTQILTVEELPLIADFDMTSLEFDPPGSYQGTAPVTIHFTNTSQNYIWPTNPLNPTGDTTFFWNFNYDNSDWIITHDVTQEFDTTYTMGGTYEICLIAVNANDCKDTVCKEIIIFDPLEFQPVNVFTPDGDGINDEFTFFYLSVAVKEFHCVVVDRWGVTIIEFDNITDTWDGKDSKGKQCPDGVYFYTYEGEAENGDQFSGQGNVTIVNGK